MKTVTTWKKGQEFTSRQGHNEIELDGTTRQGFSPKALLLAGLAACSGIDVAEILEKMRVAFSDLIIETEAEQTDGQPRVFRDFQLTYRITTAPENKAKVKKAIDLSLEKYCGVSAMLKKHAPINYEIVIAGSE